MGSRITTLVVPKEGESQLQCGAPLPAAAPALDMDPSSPLPRCLMTAAARQPHYSAFPCQPKRSRRLKLANHLGAAAMVPEAEEQSGSMVVGALYEALNTRNVEAVHRLLAPDIGWWFHGPPSCQHMMRLLTGAAPDDSFVFDPVSVAVFDATVLVEGKGWGGSSGAAGPVAWIHAWTVADGIITEVREYFETSLTVTRLGSADSPSPSPSPASSISSGKSCGRLRGPPSSASASPSHCRSVPLWQSKLSGGAGNKSVPALVLAI